MVFDLSPLHSAKTPLEFVRTAKAVVDIELAALIGTIPVWDAARQITSIASYATFAGGGGKRIRPALALLIARCCGVNLTEVIIPAAAIELIHTYTLIIDDIQDGDQIRRGEPAAHVKFGMNLSLLSASALLIEGTSLLQENSSIPPVVLREILQKLHAGQEADLESTFWLESNRDRASMEFIFAGKTGALFELSCLAGLGPQSSDTAFISKIANIGSAMGILFQAVDDFLEVTGNENQTGKPIGKNRGDKLTFMSLFSDQEQARQAIEARREQLIDSIQDLLFGDGRAFLQSFVNALVDRTG
jgi:geranylgeranyl pyrophosphate synthase